MRPPTSRPISPGTRAWWAYERAAAYDVAGTTIAVPLRDGVTIACELRRPAHGGVPVEGQFPSVVVEFTPYMVLRDFYVGEADFFTARGYNALVPLLRGVGDSGGRWEHGSFRQAGRDAHDLIEWLAAQPFSDGRVGMFGESFGGQTSYGAALERPEHLVAIAPMQSPSSLYHDVVFPGGIKSTERGEIDNWPDIANLTTGGVVDADAEYAANRAHPTFDGFWRDRSFVGCLDDVSIPVLAIGGWNDGYFRSGTLANIEAVPGRTWAVYGPWEHFFPVALVDQPAWSTGASGDERARVMAETPQMAPGVLLAWFDCWVAGMPDVPVPPEPTFTSFEGPVGTGAGWRELDGWDPTGSAVVQLQLGGDGTLGVAADPGGTTTVHQPVPPGELVDVVTFTSTPLATDQVLLGHPSLTLRATLDAPEAHLYVELLDVEADGGESLVNDGFLAASHRGSHTDPEPVPVGESTELCVPIRAGHHRFVAGHRVRLRVSGGAPSKLMPPPAPATVRIATDGTAVLRLPGFTPDR
ncbi:MAG TPA: CocE/NonD family hydrolase [Acidimicrobiia bacterium]|nr:CocE/NonD family hydrolase [Acidimicrobiia bacterium]